MKAIIILIAFFFLFSFFTFPSFAATFTFTGTPSSISDTESFSVQVSFSIGSPPGTKYYIRAAFSHPDSSTKYFGYTKNNSGSWYNGTPSIDYTQYYQITLDENSQWSGSIEVKPDIEDTDYKGSGTYNFKVGRYTEAGSGPTWCTADGCSVASISITSPTPTPTSTPTPVSTPTPAATTSPTPTPKINTPTPNKTPTKTPTPSPNRAPTPTLKPSTSPALGLIGISSPSPILGESTESASIVSPTNAKLFNKKNVLSSNKSKNPNNNFQKILIFLGVVFIASCAILTFQRFKNNKLKKDE